MGQFSVEKPVLTGSALSGNQHLAAMQLGLGPAWAVGSVGAISFMPVLPNISRLVILAEAGEASQRAVYICARRWKRAGRRVTISRSEVGSDHNDILMQHRGAA